MSRDARAWLAALTNSLQLNAAVLAGTNIEPASATANILSLELFRVGNPCRGEVECRRSLTLWFLIAQRVGCSITRSGSGSCACSASPCSGSAAPRGSPANRAESRQDKCPA